MMDVLAKLSMMPLLTFKRGHWTWWMNEVWLVELDAQICCDGYMCGCRGSTWREAYSHYNRAFRWLAD